MSWTRPPQHGWSLDEVKQGNVVATYSLKDIIQTHYNSRNNGDGFGVTFGRIADDPSLVDIVTSHESCSRRHARIAFDRDGTPWLRDMGSGNGTFVNERRLPPEACGKEDATSGANTNFDCNRKGSRGVMLFPGDAIRFGASTRIYILEGPEEFERDAIELKRKMNAAAAAASQNEQEAPPPPPTVNYDAGCSWGMADDLSDAGDKDQRFQVKDERTPLPSMDSFFYSQNPKYKIPTVLIQLHSQLNAKMHKLQSIQTESQRILQKENMGVDLTDGQRGQLAKNEERIVTLEKEVANLKDRIEDGMFRVIHPGKDRSKRPADEDQYHSVDDDGDDFFDRTAPSKRQRKDDAAESEGSLIQKWKSLLEGHGKQQLLVTRALERCARLQKQIDSSAEDDDDVFFLKNDLALASNDLSKASRCAEETVKEVDVVEHLLKIVNAKLVWDRREGLIGTNIQKKDEASTEGLAHTAPDILNDDSEIMQPPPPSEMSPPPLLAAPQPAQNAPDVLNDDSVIMPPPPPSMMSPPPPLLAAPQPSSHAEKRVLGPMRPPSRPGDGTFFVDKSSMSPPIKLDTAQRKKKPLLGPSSTLAVLKQASTQPKPSPNPGSKNSAPHTNNVQDNDAQRMTSFNPFEKKKDEWKAPVDQDGSGRTALHEKFKGRY